VYTTKYLKYKEYHSVCPLVGIGTPPHPSPECVLPPEPEGGGVHLPAGEGAGESQFRRPEKKLSNLPTLWCTLYSEQYSTEADQYVPTFFWFKNFSYWVWLHKNNTWWVIFQGQAIFLSFFPLILSEAILSLIRIFSVYIGVADPDSSDPYVFGPPGSGSGPINQRYGSGSGSFYHQAKIVRKTLIPTVLWLLFWLFIFEKWCKCTFKK
jgi:hypothetical protein